MLIVHHTLTFSLVHIAAVYAPVGPDGLERTEANRAGIWVSIYYRQCYGPDPVWGKKWSQSVPVMLRFATVHCRCSPVGATVCPAASRKATVLPRTPWRNRESPYLHLGHSSCRFNIISPSCPTVEIRIMPKELRWCPRKSRRWFAPSCAPGILPGDLFPVQHGLSRFNAVLAGAATVWSL